MKKAPSSTDKRDNLIDELHTLLKKQTQTLKNGKYQELEKLIEKTGTIITEIGQDPSPLPPQVKNRAEQINNLYKDLELMIETEKNVVDRQLQKVTCGKRAIRTYQNK